ncbi:MAG TPA: hypothetical protein VNL73_04125 [Verrucomicrobiae bacterium]|nr:hypothetical protein [Verrucomicrobiae bacterium]
MNFFRPQGSIGLPLREWRLNGALAEPIALNFLLRAVDDNPKAGKGSVEKGKKLVRDFSTASV